MRSSLFALLVLVLMCVALQQCRVDPFYEHESLLPRPASTSVQRVDAQSDALVQVAARQANSSTRRSVPAPSDPAQFVPADLLVGLHSESALQGPQGLEPEADLPRVTFHLRAVDQARSPLTGHAVGISVDLFFHADRGVTTHAPVPPAGRPVRHGGAVRATAPDGRVSITLGRGLFPDRVNVVRIRNEDDSLAAVRTNIVIPQSGVVDLGDVHLLRPSERFPASIASGTVFDNAGRPIDGVVATRVDAYVQDFDVEISASASILDPVVLWVRATDFEVVISPHGAFRVYGPDVNRGRVEWEPMRFALKWEAPGLASLLSIGVAGDRDLRVRFM